MKQKQIILYGVGNSGKSTTLRILFEKHIKENKDFTVIDGDATSYEVDYLLTAKYKGKKIGIYTWGDNEKSVKEALEHTKDCDVSICAARSKGAGYQIINQLPVSQVWIKKCGVYNKDKAISDAEYETLQKEINEQSADQIYQVLQFLCK